MSRYEEGSEEGQAIASEESASYWESKDLDAALNARIPDLHTEADRAELYERLFAIIDRDGNWDFPQAYRRLQNALKAELEEAKHPAGSPTPAERMEAILSAVDRRLASRPELFEYFCVEAKYYWPDMAMEAIIAWLERHAEAGEASPVSSAAVLAARIFYGVYGETWQEAGERLVAAVDHEDLTVRACAAHQIGKFCRPLDAYTIEFGEPEEIEERERATAGMLPVSTYWDWIRQKEVERPGVAGAFCWAANLWGTDRYEWLLTLLEEAAPEPYILYCPANLGFLAHEWYSCDPLAIRRLMNAGRFDIALAAACEEKYTPVEGMAPILRELGERDHPEEVRLASWWLAYLYNELHPKGERLGYVQRHTKWKDCDLYLLYSKRTEPENPYTAVLYPKAGQRYWTAAKAQALIDRIFPPTVRSLKPEDEPRSEYAEYSHGFSQQYLCGFVELHTVRNSRQARAIDRINIGYRADLPWDPLADV